MRRIGALSHRLFAFSEQNRKGLGEAEYGVNS